MLELHGHVARLQEIRKAEPHPEIVDSLYVCWQPMAECLLRTEWDRDKECLFVSISQAEICKYLNLILHTLCVCL